MAPPPALPTWSPSVAAALAAGIGAFDRGDYHLSHELWEEAWRQVSGPSRELVRGMILVAAACHKWQEGALAPAGRLLSRARAAGSDLPGGEDLVREVEALQQRLARARPGTPWEPGWAPRGAELLGS